LADRDRLRIVPNERVYASMVTVNGTMDDFDEIAAMAGESLLPWIRQFEGYKGFLVLVNAESGVAHFMTLWDSLDAVEKSAHSRKQVREQLAKTAGAQIASAGTFSILLTDGLE
jgi:hypothetical protein